VPWDPSRGQFACPCHGSIYEPTGQNVAGPAPRPMDYMEIQIRGDEIWVNTGAIFERRVHSDEHVTKV